MNENCIFCKIVAGTLPACKVYEDDDVMAFIDIGPIIKGHTLVIRKNIMIRLWKRRTTSFKTHSCCQENSARTDKLGADGINIIQANGNVGQEVPHLHFM